MFIIGDLIKSYVEVVFAVIMLVIYYAFSDLITECVVYIGQN